MTTAGFKKELRALGARFKEGAKHTKVYLNGRQTTLPRHKEISDQFANMIRKQLGV
jgi:mRNA interferase HicA